MVIKSDVAFLSKEVKQSKKTGNSYLSVLLMQGSETLTCLSEIDISADFGKPFTGIFELNTKYNNLKLVGVE